MGVNGIKIHVVLLLVEAIYHVWNMPMIRDVNGVKIHVCVLLVEVIYHA